MDVVTNEFSPLRLTPIGVIETPFDAPAAERTGWLATNSHKARALRSDDRFQAED